MQEENVTYKERSNRQRNNEVVNNTNNLPCGDVEASLFIYIKKAKASGYEQSRDDFRAVTPRITKFVYKNFAHITLKRSRTVKHALKKRTEKTSVNKITYVTHCSRKM